MFLKKLVIFCTLWKNSLFWRNLTPFFLKKIYSFECRGINKIGDLSDVTFVLNFYYNFFRTFDPFLQGKSAKNEVYLALESAILCFILKKVFLKLLCLTKQTLDKKYIFRKTGLIVSLDGQKLPKKKYLLCFEVPPTPLEKRVSYVLFQKATSCDQKVHKSHPKKILVSKA